ncbi:hypothetical protein [Bdellovibrio reynosensis]|uniref:Collagen-like protein n=1 Tax=Bdellovibrio reynosensis TaxID=2835041 RepID=A0ABY4CB86_9BACT|nr:hypothetical protein [Bdellovibrio reynosensis]UOF02175.1 hypothetical protein MNR06_04305 [Bdellovibrio reynosensis]
MQLNFSNTVLGFLVFMALGCSDSGLTKKINVGTDNQSQNNPDGNIYPEGIAVSLNKVEELDEKQKNFSGFKNNLNIYEAMISIRKENFSDNLEIRRSFNAEEEKPTYHVLSKSSAQLIKGYYVIRERLNLWAKDLNKKTVSYIITVNGKNVGERKAILVPDLIIKDGISLSLLGLNNKKYEFDDIVFEKGASLRTHGADIEFVATRVFANDGAIETFSASDAEATPAGQNGRNGGKILLTAETGVGKLTVNLRGTRGGKGAKGTSRTSSEKGADGADGTSAEWRTEWGFPPRLVCTKKATSGLPGQKGPNGDPGHNGGNGGNSGSAFLFFETVSNFNLTVNRFPGRAGEGGDGGDGGPGGKGGAPGYDIFECSSNVTPGADGPYGDPGARGQDGKPGASEKSSAIVAGKEIL